MPPGALVGVLVSDRNALTSCAAPPLAPQDAVRLCSADGAEFARALINYSSEEVDAAKVGVGGCVGVVGVVGVWASGCM